MTWPRKAAVSLLLFFGRSLKHLGTAIYSRGDRLVGIAVRLRGEPAPSVQPAVKKGWRY